MIIPCKDCLLIPVCRHKRYVQIMDDCSTVKTYVYDKDFIEGIIIEKDALWRRAKELKEVLNSNEFDLVEMQDGNRYITATKPPEASNMYKGQRIRSVNGKRKRMSLR